MNSVFIYGHLNPFNEPIQYEIDKIDTNGKNIAMFKLGLFYHLISLIQWSLYKYKCL